MSLSKITTISLAAIILAVAHVANAQTTNTNYFPLTFKAVCTSTNSSGLFRERVVNANLIGDCAYDHNITNLSTLRLVFNRSNYSILVVGTNGVPVCTNFTFTGGLTLTNTNNTQLVFQRDVRVGTNLTATGTLFGTATWNPTNLFNTFGLEANLLYTEPAVGTNGVSICHAELRVGSSIRTHDGDDDDDDDDDDDGGNNGNNGNHGNGNNGNNGNHYGWQNPKNPHSRR